MKRLFIFILMTMFILPSVKAQSEKEQATQEQKAANKQRSEKDKETKALIEKKALKDARAQAKQLAKDGWKTAPGSLPLDKQLSNMLMRQYEMDGRVHAYIIGRSSAHSSSYGVARRQAIARAKLEIASNMETEIVSLMENTDVNTELSNGDVQTVAKMIDTNKQLVQQTIGRTDVVFEIYREKDNDTEVQIGLSYDGELAMNTLLKLFEKDNAEIKAKLEQLIQKEPTHE